MLWRRAALPDGHHLFDSAWRNLKGNDKREESGKQRVSVLLSASLV